MRGPKYLVLALGIAFALVVTACTPKQSSNSSVLFEDDFSKSSSGWDSYSDTDGLTDYVDGTYHIQVANSNYDLWANPGKSFTDVQTEVDATKVSGPDDNDFGLICRYTDADNYYFAVVASDGYYGFGKLVKGTQTLFGADSGLSTTDLVKSGSELNHLRFDCIGSTLTLYINGSQAGSIEDSDLASGDVGLIAGTFDTAGVEIKFDNFKVLKP